MTRKAQVFVIKADETKVLEMQKLVEKYFNPKVIGKFNSIGEITSPSNKKT